MSINNQCDDKIFILISSKTIFLFNFDSQNENSPNLIYQTESNTTIENGLFNKRTNTIFLLLNQFNKTYSIYSLNVYDNIYKHWNGKSNKMFYSSYIYLTLGQRYLYLLNNQTMLLQIFNLPLTSTSSKENYLVNLPKNQIISDYIIDEKFGFLWILFESNQYQLYICQLKTYSCQFYMTIFNINKPNQFLINWKSQQFYLYSKNYLITFEYNQNQTNYAIQYLNSTQQQFLTICEKTNSIEYISINSTNKREICFQTCQYLPSILDDTNRIHTIRSLPSLLDILYCSKQRQIIKIVILILILLDIVIILGVITWLAYKYFYQSTKQINSRTIWTTEKEFITHF